MLGQLLNLWKGTSTREFNRGLTPAGDGYAVGKMAMMEQRGILKNIGALCLVVPDRVLTQEEMLEYRRSWMTSFAWKAYLDKDEIKRHRYYFSRIGMNGFFYGLWNTVFKSSPETCIKFIKFQKSLLFSIILSLIIVWISSYAGVLGGLLVLVSLALSPVVTGMGTSLYYVSFSWYVPFGVATYLLDREYKGKIVWSQKHYFICAGAFLCNLVFNCFELISAVGLSSVIPFVFFAFLSGNYRTMFIRMVKSGLLNICMCFITLFLLFFQYKVANHTTIADGASYVKKKFLTRTVGEKKDAGKVVKSKQLHASKEAAYLDVIKLSIGYPATVINDKKHPVAGLEFKGLILLILVAAILGFLLFYFLAGQDRSLYALVMTSVISISAPLSWLIIFKPHAFLHMHFVVFTWYLPFVIFGMATIGAVISTIYLRYRLDGISAKQSENIAPSL